MGESHALNGEKALRVFCGLRPFSYVQPEVSLDLMVVLMVSRSTSYFFPSHPSREEEHPFGRLGLPLAVRHCGSGRRGAFFCPFFMLERIHVIHH